MNPLQGTRKGLSSSCVALAICALLGSSGCGIEKGAVAPGSAARTQPSPASGYASYVSSAGKYSFEYPAAWHDGGPELLDGQFVAKDFSSQNIPSPILLSDDGIWLTVTLDMKPTTCLSRSGPLASANPIQVSIDGVAGIAYVSLGADPNVQGGDGLTGVSGPYVMHKGWCYWFGFLTTTLANTNQHMAEIRHVYSSFRFNR